MSETTTKPPFNWRYFLQDNVTGSPLLFGWVVGLMLLTLTVTVVLLQSNTIATIVIGVIWLGSVLLTYSAEVNHRHTRFTQWLKTNLYNSVTNILLTLLLTLLLVTGVQRFFVYAIVNASFSSDPLVNRTVTQAGTMGARWGAVRVNFLNMLFFRMKDEMARIYATVAMLIVLGLPSLVVFRTDQYKGKWPRQLLTWLWGISPFFAFYFLHGFGKGGLDTQGNPTTPFRWIGFLFAIPLIAAFVLLQRLPNTLRQKNKVISLLLSLTQYLLIPLALLYVLTNQSGSGYFYALDIDQKWGGLLLTLIITVFSIVVSFPLGILLALGRRSDIQGIPPLPTYIVAVLLMLLLLPSSIQDAIAASSVAGKLLSLWPLLIPLLAYFFQRIFKGNIVATFSTLYIEIVRGVPFITILFMSIILFPLFLPPNWEVKNMWRVLAATSLFSAAYLAENVRGGLQAISKGQYESADSLGLSTFQKYRFIILPQALRLIIPTLVNHFIALFKDTSLVYLVGLFDLLEVANKISAQPDWLTVRTEPYLFLFVIYYTLSGLMAAYSQHLEKRLAVGQR